jgi:hypothetical protein
MADQLNLKPYLPRQRILGGEDFLRHLNGEFREVSEALQRFAAPSYEVDSFGPGQLVLNGEASNDLYGHINLSDPNQAAASVWVVPRKTVTPLTVGVMARWSRSSDGPGIVAWDFHYRVHTLNEVVPAWTTISSTGVWSEVCQDTNTANKYLVSIVGYINLPLLTAEPLVQFRLNPNASTTYNATIQLHALSFIYGWQPRGTRDFKAVQIQSAPDYVPSSPTPDGVTVGP